MAPGTNRFEKSLLASMQMNDTTWMRHANPWSVWTRFTCLPFIILALWSRQWIGLWFFLPLLASFLWIYFNPRIFPIPDNMNHWPAKATFGERVWLNRLKIPIPAHHARAAFFLSLLTLVGTGLLLYGVYLLSLTPTLFGLAIAILAKAWFCDRMVWLYEDMRKQNAVYESWIKRPVNDNIGYRAA